MRDEIYVQTEYYKSTNNIITGTELFIIAPKVCKSLSVYIEVTDKGMK